tara:strand:+ start:241 stop:399 length:159 start_codon:yes stop_codon:yes gene_type:complete
VLLVEEGKLLVWLIITYLMKSISSKKQKYDFRKKAYLQFVTKEKGITQLMSF